MTEEEFEKVSACLEAQARINKSVCDRFVEIEAQINRLDRRTMHLVMIGPGPKATVPRRQQPLPEALLEELRAIVALGETEDAP